MPDPKKSCHSGKNQKMNIFLIFTRNPLLPSFFDLLAISNSLDSENRQLHIGTIKDYYETFVQILYSIAL
jgi:hypothetical protein